MIYVFYVSARGLVLVRFLMVLKEISHHPYFDIVCFFLCYHAADTNGYYRNQMTVFARCSAAYAHFLWALAVAGSGGGCGDGGDPYGAGSCHVIVFGFPFPIFQSPF